MVTAVQDQPLDVEYTVLPVPAEDVAEQPDAGGAGPLRAAQPESASPAATSLQPLRSQAQKQDQSAPAPHKRVNLRGSVRQRADGSGRLRAQPVVKRSQTESQPGTMQAPARPSRAGTSYSQPCNTGASKPLLLQIALFLMPWLRSWGGLV